MTLRNDNRRQANRYSLRQQAVWMWHASKGMRLQAVLNAVIGTLVVGADFATIWCTKHIIDIVTGVHDGSFGVATAVLIALFAVRIVLGVSTRWVQAMLGVKAQNRLQVRLFGRMLACRWQGREKHHSGDVLNRLEQDVREVVKVITETLPQAFAVGVRLVGAFIFMSMMDYRLTVIVTVLLPAMILLSRVYVGRMRSLTRSVRDSDSRIQSLLQESVQHRMVIKTLQAIDTAVQRLEGMQAVLRSQVRQRARFSIASSVTLSTGFSAAYLITFIWSAHSLQEGTITYGMMIAFVQLVGQIQMPFRDMTRFAPVIVQALTAGERMMELEEQPVEELRTKDYGQRTKDYGVRSKDKGVRTMGALGFRVKDATYKYPDGHRVVLNHVNATFAPGRTTAIVGETGAGKTTLIRLMLGLMQPIEGTVEMYDENGWSTPCSVQTRSHIVYVPQGNTLLSGTVRDNLLLARPDATDDDMVAALRTACADFVLELATGLDTPCGELGAGMSEGQAQRICIARSLLCRGNVLLMDEATSALDEATELRLLHNLSELPKPRTIIFITHRHAVLQFCDDVVNIL